MKRIGIDGCQGGWLVVSGDPAPGPLTFELVRDLSSLFAEAEAGQALITIDTPIGLADCGGRDCDAAARALLGDRACCVFTAPSRAALGGSNYLEASELNFAACGKRLSRQAYGILPPIAQVDRLIRPDLQDRIREVHPEVTFAVLAGSPLREPKKSARGRELRLELLSRSGIEPDVERVRSFLGRGCVQADDVLDACAAYRAAGGSERVLPEASSQRDSRGLRMEIVA